MFKKPLEGALGISGTLSALPFTIGIVVLGLSAAIFGTWVDRNGPRTAMFAAMCCFSGGWLVGSVGLATRQYWLGYSDTVCSVESGGASATSRRYPR